MPQKWRIYRVSLIINAALVAFVLIFYLYIIWRPGIRIYISHGELLLIIMLPVIYCFNLLYSLRLLSASFPVNDPISFSKGLCIALLILFTIELMGLMLLFCIGFNEEFFKYKEYRSGDRSGLYVLLYIFVLLVLGVYNTVMQIKLLSRFSAGKKESIDTMVDEIGQDIID